MVLAILDYEEMQEGENITSHIKEDIATTSIHVPIFSLRYAESDWCLNELLLMRRPADLQWKEGKDGVYAHALHNLQNKKTHDSETHEEKPRYDSDTIESWRKALPSVAEISGFEMEACGNGDEGELLDKVVILC